MKKILATGILLLLLINLDAQKVEYKDGIIEVDGSPLAKMTVEKKNFGLTKFFEVYSLTGKKLIIGAPATEFETDKSDNSTLYYRLTFLTSNQVGIFKLNALGQEKSFVKLIGTSGIIKSDSTDDNKVKEFIALRSASPTIAVDYTVVARDRMWPVRIQDDKTFEQQGKIIGSFKSKGSIHEADHYEFTLPSGVIIARVSFTGGNNAQNFELFTAKDNLKRVVPSPQTEKIIATGAGIDKNWMTVLRVAKWLVDKQYM